MIFDYDVVIIGAGIHGAACAREAALNGLSVLVVDQYPVVAHATSSRSSKLIHGGLRYLESRQFHLVYECLREQKVLLRCAPHLVHRSPFIIPVLKNSVRPVWMIKAGLWLYFMLGGTRPSELDLTIAAQNGLRHEQFLCALSYSDAQTDDAALTRSVLYSAQLSGAQIALQTQCSEMSLVDDVVQLVLRKADGSLKTVTSRSVINAAGPWVNRLLSSVTPTQPMVEIEWIRGTHIELPGSLDRCFYVEAEDGRAVFVLPWRGRRLVGTTERLHATDPGDVRATDEEIDYLLATYNRYFSPACRAKDIVSAWAGLRVLPVSSQAAFSRSRDAILWADRQNNPRLVSIYGGKLTSHRATAKRVLHVLQLKAGKSVMVLDSKQQYLPIEMDQGFNWASPLS